MGRAVAVADVLHTNLNRVRTQLRQGRPDKTREVTGHPAQQVVRVVAEQHGAVIHRVLDVQHHSERVHPPWKQRSWILPRDPDFETKAGRVLDLYARTWNGKPFGKRGYVISADEKTSIQARQRCHDTLAPASGRDLRVEHEYDRGGSLAYIAAWDLHRAKVFGRCEEITGIAPFGRLVDHVMTAEPYASPAGCSGSSTTAAATGASAP